MSHHPLPVLHCSHVAPQGKINLLHLGVHASCFLYSDSASPGLSTLPPQLLSSLFKEALQCKPLLIYKALVCFPHPSGHSYKYFICLLPAISARTESPRGQTGSATRPGPPQHLTQTRQEPVTMVELKSNFLIFPSGTLYLFCNWYLVDNYSSLWLQKGNDLWALPLI